MKYLHLIWAALFRHKVRALLTLLSVLVAFLLFGLLDAVRSSFAKAGQSVHGEDRLVCFSKMNFSNPLPYSLAERIRNVPGVVEIDHATFVSGTYQTPANPVFVEGHSKAFFDVYPELEVAPEQRLALQNTLSGVVAGETIARKYNWKIGDKIPLQTSIPRNDGSTTWTFDVVGFFRFTAPDMKVWENLVYGNWEYMDKARRSDSGTVAWISIKIANPNEIDRVAQAVDAISENSDHETKTQSENSWAAAQFSQIGDIGLIVTSVMGAVFFTLLILTGHTMAQAVEERIPEFAILKTIGFSGRSIMGMVLSESMLLLLLGGVAGLALATLTLTVVRSLPGYALLIPAEPLRADVWLRGLTLAMLMGVIVGALPALRGLRLRILVALSRG